MFVYQDASQKFAKAIASLSQADAVAVGLDPGGTRVLEVRAHCPAAPFPAQPANRTPLAAGYNPLPLPVLMSQKPITRFVDLHAGLSRRSGSFCHSLWVSIYAGVHAGARIGKAEAVAHTRSGWQLAGAGVRVCQQPPGGEVLRLCGVIQLHSAHIDMLTVRSELSRCTGPTNVTLACLYRGHQHQVVHVSPVGCAGEQQHLMPGTCSADA